MGILSDNNFSRLKKHSQTNDGDRPTSGVFTNVTEPIRVREYSKNECSDKILKSALNIDRQAAWTEPFVPFQK
ncbi:MAG TPA: hypothetical protein DIW81_16555 [Planctomycetaceae bacterium]|nr:hypothetical protein [Planctomycetaceae bacterium]